MVGPKIGQFHGGLASPADSQCMKDVEVRGWRYTDGSARYKHSQLMSKKRASSARQGLMPSLRLQV